MTRLIVTVTLDNATVRASWLRGQGVEIEYRRGGAVRVWSGGLQRQWPGWWTAKRGGHDER